MKADWILRIELSRFFENHSELRARVKVGKFKDQIHRAVFAAKLEEKFTKDEIKQGCRIGYIGFDKIRHEAGAIRNIYTWLDKECIYQPIWYKRLFQQFKDWFLSKVLTS